MIYNTFIRSTDDVVATEAPDVATEVAEIKNTSRPKSASKRAPQIPNVLAVSVDNAVVCLDVDATLDPRTKT